MIATADSLNPAKSRRRTSAKASVRASAPKVKQTLVLSEDSARRLAVHSAMLGVDRSALVDQLIQEHMRRFRVSDLDRNDTRDTGEDRQSGTAA